MPSVLIVWNDEVIRKLAERDVTPEEFTEVVMYAHRDDVSRSRSSGRPLVFGTTDSGRLLACVFEYLDDDQFEVIPITAWEP